MVTEQAESLRESEELLKSQQEELQQTNEELQEKAALLARQKAVKLVSPCEPSAKLLTTAWSVSAPWISET